MSHLSGFMQKSWNTPFRVCVLVPCRNTVRIIRTCERFIISAQSHFKMWSDWVRSQQKWDTSSRNLKTNHFRLRDISCILIGLNENDASLTLFFKINVSVCCIIYSHDAYDKNSLPNVTVVCLIVVKENDQRLNDFVVYEKHPFRKFSGGPLENFSHLRCQYSQ